MDDTSKDFSTYNAENSITTYYQANMNWRCYV